MRCLSPEFCPTFLVMMYIYLLVLMISHQTVSGSGLEGRVQVDLIEGLQLFNTTYPGVSSIPGTHSFTPAISLTGDTRHVRLPESVLERSTALLAASAEFTIMASLKQRPQNAGTIVALSFDSDRFLEIQSSGRTDEIRFHYTRLRPDLDTPSRPDVHMESFSYRLADDHWHRLAVSVSGQQLDVFVDCRHVHSRVIHAPQLNATAATLGRQDGQHPQLWLGQRNARHFMFQGALQDVRLVFGRHGYLAQCPELDATCPSCGQFDTLQAAVLHLERTVQQLTQRLRVAEESLKQLESCECQRSCHANNTFHADGTSWEDGCRICACMKGEVKCRPIKCNVNCSHPVSEPGECCPKCKGECFLEGRVYEHGERVSSDRCSACLCEDSVVQCSRIIPEKHCPALSCPPAQRLNISGQCCQFCRDTDYCAQARPPCDPHATCVNLQTSFMCQCNDGYQGNGETCEDLNECESRGGYHGHQCGPNTVCRNTIGGYQCDCLPGYQRHDAYMCVERDECADGSHNCHARATCVNTPGGFQCRCPAGYTGDGTECTPVCSQQCENGGRCVAPDTCSCRRGFVGPGCERDVDECALQLHQCGAQAQCVNMPGWYHCRCRAGYRAAGATGPLGVSCTDVDECADGSHTCGPLTSCVNTNGSYTCHCQGDQCVSNCTVKGVEHPHGSSWQDADRKCHTCTCRDGVATCQRHTCDCNQPHQNKRCCPECDSSSGCFHQTLPNVRFHNGDRWLHQCQLCECLTGQIDCWQQQCPPTSCANPRWPAGDCCPRCEDDPCAPSENASAALVAAGCNIAAPPPPPLASAAQWHSVAADCEHCRCKVPFCEKLEGQLLCGVSGAGDAAAIAAPPGDQPLSATEGSTNAPPASATVAAAARHGAKAAAGGGGSKVEIAAAMDADRVDEARGAPPRT